jgi:hypothetical protein
MHDARKPKQGLNWVGALAVSHRVPGSSPTQQAEWQLGRARRAGFLRVILLMLRGENMIDNANTRTLIENEAAALWYHPKKKIVHHELRRFVHGDEFRQILEQGLAAFRTYGACKWLSDDRGNGPLKPSDGEWAQNDWAPRVISAGWKYWAVVWPEKVVAQMNMKRWMADYAARGVTVASFKEPVEAMRWLELQG